MEMILRLPNNYVEIEEEMMYLDGGDYFYKRTLGFLAGLVTEWVREDIAEVASKETSYVQINWGYAAWTDIYNG